MSAESWFAGDNLEGLGTRALRSGATAVGARGAQLVVQLGAAMTLARILTPADFGIAAMVLPLAFLLLGIANQALQSAVMQQDRLEPADASALFYGALPINASLTIGMALLGPALAWLYDEPRVVLVTIVWAAVIFLAGLSAIHEGLLKRQHRFATIARVQLSAQALAVALAIVCAIMGFGYWALVLQVAVMELMKAGTVWRLVSWRPTRTVAGPRARALRSYWLGLMGARAVSWIGDQSDRVAVGALGGAPVAGLYDSAKRWAWFPFFELFIPLTDVAVAGLSRVRHDAERFRAYVRQALSPVMAVTLPVAGFMFAEARLVLHAFLGMQWLGAAVFVRWLCIAIVGATIIRLVQWIYLATGMTMRQLRWSFVTTPVILAAVIVGGVTMGPVGVVAGLTLATLVLAVPSTLNAIRGTPLTLSDCLGVMVRPLLATALAIAVLWRVESWLPVGPPLLAMLERLAMFGAIYLLGWLVLPGGSRALGDLWLRALRAVRPVRTR